MSRRRTRAARDGALRLVWRYAGWIIIAVVVFNWAGMPPAWVAGALGLAATHFAFVTPTWCAATTRQETPCRNNAQGVLRGCHLQNHKWQMFKKGLVPEPRRAAFRRAWKENAVNVMGLLVSIVATCAAVVQAAVAVLAA